VALATGRGEVLGWEFEATGLALLPGGGAEQDPADWWRAITTAAQRLVSRGLAPVDEVAAVACTSQWSGTVAVDAAGQPLTNALIWMDARGAPHIDRLIRGPIAVEGYAVDRLLTWLRLTGGAPTRSGKDSIAHILYLKHERPDIYRAAHTFLEPKDFLNLKLTGCAASSPEAMTLHWVTDNRDIGRIDYSPRLLRMAGLDRAQLPDLRPATAVLGTLRAEAAADLGLRPGVPVVAGTPDIHSAALGSGAVEDYAGHLYLGTSSWLTCHVPFKKTDLAHNMASLPSALPGRYFIVDEQECAGACLNYLRDVMFFADDALATGPRPAHPERLFDQLAAEAPAGSGGLIFMPWLNGERTPVDDHHVRGGFFNQSLRTRRADLVRAVFEGVAFNARWLLGHVEAFTGRRFPALTLIGGGGNSDVWCQIMADVLERPIRQAQDPVLANVRGAAFLAGLALGEVSVADIGRCVPIKQTYQPNPDHRRLYDGLYREFGELYRRTRGVYARLNPL
jgi:xylulokinase